MAKFFIRVPNFKSFCLNEGFNVDEFSEEENEEMKDSEEVVEGKTYRENYKSHKNKLDGKFSKKMKTKRSGNGQMDSEAYEKYKDYGDNEDDEQVDEGRSYRDYYKKYRNNMDGKRGKKMKDKRSGNGQMDSEAYEKYKDYGDDDIEEKEDK